MSRPISIPSSRRLFYLLLCSMLALPAVAQHVKKQTYKQVIAQLESQWFEAQRTNDTAIIDRLLSDDYIGVSSQGMVSSKAQALARMQTRQIVVNHVTPHDQKITIHGDTAIVTSQVDIDYMNNTVQPPVDVHTRLRYTRVYLHYPSGTWRIVNFEATHIADLPGAGPLSPEPGSASKP